jgi:hypothetical protein
MNHTEYMREWRAKNPEKERKIRGRRMEKLRLYKKNWREKYPAKVKAENLANKRHIPLDSNCLMCGSTENLEKHHPDYEQPSWILTLCQKCHKLIHRLIHKL